MFKAIIIFIVVNIFVDSVLFSQSLPTSTASPQPFPYMGQPDVCYGQWQSYNTILQNLANKCSGSSEKACYDEAKKCSQGSEPGQGGIFGPIQNTLSSVLTGGFPLVNADSGAFKCLPTNRLEQVRSQMEKLKEEAKKNYDKAVDYSRKVKEEAKEINKEISQMKKQAVETVKALKKNEQELPENIRKIREKASELAVQIQNNIDANAEAMAKKYGEIEIEKTNRGELYVNTIGKCTDQTNAAKNSLITEFDKALEDNQKILDEIQDPHDRTDARRKFKNKIKKKEKQYKDALNSQYNGCLREQTQAYNNKFKEITRIIGTNDREITRIKNATDALFKKLNEIPRITAEQIKTLKDATKNEKESAQSEMFALQQEIQQSIRIYEEKYAESKQSFMEAQVKQQISQIQQMSTQSLYHMNTFGDAAPWLDGLERARKELCDLCGRNPEVRDSALKAADQINSTNPEIPKPRGNFSSMCEGFESGVSGSK